jgi:two-component system NtrC family sensor kinase
VITLYLPRTNEAAAPQIAQPDAEPTPQPAGAVLLVEDNAEVGEVCSAYLRQLGYQVKRAGSAQEALEVLENDADIDLVFSNILMPGFMNGLELAHAVRDRFPRLPVLLSTGYSSSAQDAVREGFIVLQKPFDIASLKQGLRQALRWKDDQPEANKTQRTA